MYEILFFLVRGVVFLAGALEELSNTFQNSTFISQNFNLPAFE